MRRRTQHGRLEQRVEGCVRPDKWAWDDPFRAQQYADTVMQSVYLCRLGEFMHYHTTSGSNGYRRYRQSGDDFWDRLQWQRWTGGV